MSKARLVITAVVVEGRSPSEVARTYNVARSWIYTLVNRYRSEGDDAFEPRSRRPTTQPSATPPDIAELVLTLRRQLTRDGLDAGADTIAWHLDELTHSFDRQVGLMVLDEAEADHLIVSRAKYAAALRRISVSVRNSMFSLRNLRNSSRSDSVNDS